MTDTLTTSMSRATATSFELYRGAAGLRALEPVWTQLVASITRADFFHQHAWYQSILETWPDTANDTLFFVASIDGAVVAICPLQLTRVRLGGLPIRVLAPPDPNSITYSDFICHRSAAPAALITDLLAHLRQRRDFAWDLMMLPRTLATATSLAGGVELSARELFAHPREECYYFRADEGMDAILADVPSNFRQQLRRQSRRLAEQGKVELVSSRDPAMLPSLFEEFLELEASGWKGAAGEGTAIRLHADLVDFYGRVMARFAENGACEINLLRLDGSAIAGQFCLLSDGTWYHLKIAYDERYPKVKPGSLLLEGVLRRLCDDPEIHTASLLTGAEWAKRWHPRAVPVMRIIGRNRTLRGYAALQQLKLRRMISERRAAARASTSEQTSATE